MKRSWKGIIVVVALLVVVGAAFSGWNWYKSRYPTWHEEVRLSDGRLIVIKQKHEYYKSYGTNQSWVTFSLPELGGERTWHSYLKPMRIDVHDGKVYAFGRPRGDRQVQYYRYPRDYIVAFQWDGEAFKRIPFNSLPLTLRASENVFPCIPERRSSVTTWAAKEAQWCPPSDSKGLLTRDIDLSVYQKLAIDFARRDGGVPLSD
jgi:hypothetical protein